MKKALALLASVCVATTLSACSGGSTPSATATAASGPVAIEFWHGYTEADGKVLDSMIEEFNASQSEVKITPVVNTWATINDKLLPALSAGTGPEFIAMPAEQVPVYASKGALQSLDDWYGSAGNPGTLNKGATEVSVVKGKNYGLPLSFTPLTMFYNKKLFEKAGASVPTTWDEWVATAEKLTIDKNNDGAPEQYGLALQDHASVGNGVWPSLLASGGGGIIDADGKVVIDSPENLATLQYWAAAVKDKKISPTGLDGVGADNLYKAGKVAMTFGGPWLASISKESNIDYGIAAIPAGPAGAKQSALAVSIGVTSKATPAQKAGIEKFFTWFFVKDKMIKWSLGSGWPPLTTDVTAADVAENADVAALTKQSPNGIALLPGVVRSTDTLTALDKLTQQSLAGGDPKALLAEASAKLTSIAGG